MTPIGPTPHRSPRRLRRCAFIGSAALALAFTACGGSDDDASANDNNTADDGDAAEAVDTSPDDGVDLLDPGDPDTTIAFPVAYETGQSAVNLVTLDMNMSIDVDGQEVSVDVGMEIILAQEVVEVDDGVTTLHSRVDGIIFSVPGTAAQEAEDEFAEIEGQTIVMHVDQNGQDVEPPTLLDGSDLPAEFAESFATTRNEFLTPTEPVGVGAVWSAISSVESNGMEIEAETIYEIREIGDDNVVLDLTQSAPLDLDMDGVSAVGSLEGSGITTMSLSNPLLVESEFTQTLDADMSGDGGQSGSMNVETVIGMSFE